MMKHLLVAFLILMAGCASIKAREQGRALEETCKDYGKAIQWGQFSKAAGFMMPDPANQITRDLAGLEKIKISSYEVIDRQVLEGGGEASQTVEIRYYHIENLIERTLLDKQRWLYDDARKHWFLMSGLPPFKDDLTGRN